MNRLLSKFFLLGLCFVSMLSVAQTEVQVPSSVVNALRTGNVDNICAYFDQSVKLVLSPNTDELFQKREACDALAAFFMKNQAKDFVVMHEGCKNDANFAIGTLTTQDAQFRINILMRQIEGATKIQQLRIEKNK